LVLEAEVRAVEVAGLQEAVAQEVEALEAEAGVAAVQAVAQEVARQALVNPLSNNLNSRHILTTQRGGINSINSNNRTLDRRNRTDRQIMLTVAEEEAVLEYGSILFKVVH
jgi:hypothetical protein